MIEVKQKIVSIAVTGKNADVVNRNLDLHWLNHDVTQEPLPESSRNKDDRRKEKTLITDSPAILLEYSELFARIIFIENQSGPTNPATEGIVQERKIKVPTKDSEGKDIEKEIPYTVVQLQKLMNEVKFFREGGTFMLGTLVRLLFDLE